MTFKRIELYRGGSQRRKNAYWRMLKKKCPLLTICISVDIIKKSSIDKGNHVHLSHDPDKDLLLITRAPFANRYTRCVGSTKNSANCTRVIKAAYKGPITEIFRSERGELIVKHITDDSLLFLMVPKE